MCGESQRIRVLLLDDVGLLRSGLRALLERTPKVQVVGEAGEVAELLNLMRQSQPDILMMQGGISTLSCLGLANDLRKDFPQVQLLLLSNKTGEYIRQALRSGFSGFVSLTATSDELATAIKRVAQGNTYISPDVEIPTEGVSEQTSKEEPLEQLSPRQREVLKLIAEGQSTKQIAAILNISAKTVETHRAQLTNKLGIQEVASLVRYAIKIGLVE